MANIIDSFFVALGFKVDPAGLKDVKKQASEAQAQLLSVGNAIKVAFGGLALKAVANVGDQFEQNRIAIAGFLSALNFSGSFNEGLKDADTTLKSITTAAAKLPGEAEDYIEVFRAGLPVLKGAMPGASLGQLTAFTNRFTAIGKTLQVDAGQIGRDFSLLLGPKGRAGGNVLAFQRMLPFIRQLKGHATETAESFNVLSQPKRLKLLQEALANPALTKMLEASAGSFDAMLGAAKSMLKTVTRLATAGLFEGMKKGLDSLRALFVDDKGEVTAMGKEFVDAGAKVSRVIVQMVTALGGLVTWILKNEWAVKLLKGAAIALGVALAGLALAKTAGMVGDLFKAVLNLKKLLLGGLLVALFLIGEDLYQFLTGGESVIGMLADKFPIASKVAVAAILGLGLAMAATRAKMVLDFVMIGAAAVAAAVRAGAAWLVAMAPIAIPIALITAGLYALWSVLDELDKKFDWVNKAANRLYDTLGIKRTTESQSLQNFNARGIGADGKFQRHGGAEDFVSTKQPGTFHKSQMPLGWNPSMNPLGMATTAASAAGGGGTTVSMGDINIRSDNPNQAGEAVAAVVRNSQQRFSH